MVITQHTARAGSVNDRMRFFKLNSLNLHKPECGLSLRACLDSRGSSVATAAAPGSLKLGKKKKC